MTPPPRSARSHLVGMLGGALLISTSAVWVRLADVAPSAAGVWRMGIASICLLAVALFQGHRVWRSPRRALLMLLPAAFFSLDLFLWHRSIHLVGPGLATILANFQVFLITAVAWIFYGEKVRKRFLAALGLAVAGLTLLVGLDVDAMGPGYVTGVALGLGAAVGYTGFILGMRSAQQRDVPMAPEVDLMYASIWSGLILAVVAAVGGESLQIPDTRSLAAMVAYGVLCQGAGWMLITGAMPRLAARVVGFVLLLQPALAFGWDVLFFGRNVRLTDLVGGLFVLVGLYIVSTGRVAPPPPEPDSEAQA